jgi:hypothetical protein
VLILVAFLLGAVVGAAATAMGLLWWALNTWEDPDVQA